MLLHLAVVVLVVVFVSSLFAGEAGPPGQAAAPVLTEPKLARATPDDGLHGFGALSAVFNYHHPLPEDVEWTGSGIDPYGSMDPRYRRYTAVLPYNDDPRVRYLQIWFVGHDLTRHEARAMVATELPADAKRVDAATDAAAASCAIFDLYSSHKVTALFGDVLILVQYDYTGSMVSDGEVNVVNVGLVPRHDPCGTVLMPPGQG